MSKFYTDRIIRDIRKGQAVCLNGWTFLRRGGRWFYHQNGCAWKYTESFEDWVSLIEAQVAVMFTKVK